ncbi:hypothetical protein HPB49_023662 [Dermacentor silvarum]|uniref:Uncharacterized protein n=1 Tax=Dermacentor silvarum TaxID=543639 RepID=A0ACB8D0R1_DERSI|nr:hypothetical protein HPB49_023662 [Dermacentor silvarum]
MAAAPPTRATTTQMVRFPMSMTSSSSETISPSAYIVIDRSRERFIVLAMSTLLLLISVTLFGILFTLLSHDSIQPSTLTMGDLSDGDSGFAPSGTPGRSRNMEAFLRATRRLLTHDLHPPALQSPSQKPDTAVDGAADEKSPHTSTPSSPPLSSASASPSESPSPSPSTESTPSSEDTSSPACTRSPSLSDREASELSEREEPVQQVHSPAGDMAPEVAQVEEPAAQHPAHHEVPKHPEGDKPVESQQLPQNVAPKLPARKKSPQRHPPPPPTADQVDTALPERGKPVGQLPSPAGTACPSCVLGTRAALVKDAFPPLPPPGKPPLPHPGTEASLPQARTERDNQLKESAVAPRKQPSDRAGTRAFNGAPPSPAMRNRKRRRRGGRRQQDDHFPVILCHDAGRAPRSRVCSTVKWAHFRRHCAGDPTDGDFFSHIKNSATAATLVSRVQPGRPVPDLRQLNLWAARRRAERRAIRTADQGDWTTYRRLDAVCRRHANQRRRPSWAGVCCSISSATSSSTAERLLRALQQGPSIRQPILATALADLLASHFATQPPVPTPDPASMVRAAPMHTTRTGRWSAAPGADGITFQMLRNLADAEKARLLDCLNAVWNNGQLPESWLTAIVVPILKGRRFPVHCSVYADDIALWTSGPRRSLPAVRTCLQETLDASVGHLASLGLTVSSAKTKALVVHPLCNRCGTKEPEPEHECKPTCTTCGEEHLAGSKDCKKRFKKPQQNNKTPRKTSSRISKAPSKESPPRPRWYDTDDTEDDEWPPLRRQEDLQAASPRQERSGSRERRRRRDKDSDSSDYPTSKRQPTDTGSRQRSSTPTRRKEPTNNKGLKGYVEETLARQRPLRKRANSNPNAPSARKAKNCTISDSTDVESVINNGQ